MKSLSNNYIWGTQAVLLFAPLTSLKSIHLSGIFRCFSEIKVFIVPLSFPCLFLSGGLNLGYIKCPCFQRPRLLMFPTCLGSRISNKLLFTLLPNRLFTEVTNNLLNRLRWSLMLMCVYIYIYICLTKRTIFIVQKTFSYYPASMRSAMESQYTY